jgi:hypothetical protein
MDAEVREIRLNQWKSIIMQACKSGMSKTAWCQENNVKLRQFFYWQGVIRRHEINAAKKCSDRSASTSIVPQSESNQPDTGNRDAFVELPLTCDEPVAEHREPDSNDTGSVRTECLKPDAMIQIRGCQIFIGEGTSERTLQTVIRAFNV